jgi:hypothetical protein
MKNEWLTSRLFGIEMKLIARRLISDWARIPEKAACRRGADGDDDIQIEESHRFIRSGNVHFLHIAFFVQFPFPENVPPLHLFIRSQGRG